jgi:hypothetical protein
MLHSYHTERAGTREFGVHHPTRRATSGCENDPPPPYPPRLRGRVGWGEGRVRWRSGRECPRRFVRPDRRRAYDPLDPLELEPWSGGAGVEGDAAGLELCGGAATGDAGFGAMWLAGWLAGAAGAAGRGAIGDTCVGAGDAWSEAGGVVETGRGGWRRASGGAGGGRRSWRGAKRDRLRGAAARRLWRYGCGGHRLRRRSGPWWQRSRLWARAWPQGWALSSERCCGRSLLGRCLLGEPFLRSYLSWRRASAVVFAGGSLGLLRGRSKRSSLSSFAALRAAASLLFSSSRRAPRLLFALCFLRHDRSPRICG